MTDTVKLLETGTHSADFYKILAKANTLSRIEYGNRGYIFAQIGINSAKCSGNCKFCSFAKDTFSAERQFEKSIDAVVEEASSVLKNNISALFLMTTADYGKDKFLAMGKAVKAITPESVDLIANTGDFDADYAKELKKAGFTGVYHIVRLREGTDTDIPPQSRINTLEAVKAAGLKLFYCVEPIGKEHTYEEIATEMIRARDYGVDVMAVMRRVAVKGSIFTDDMSISQLELTKIAAVARIVTRPKISMNVHEPMMLPLLAGVNQLYAEIGTNPRDTAEKTENSRGFSVKQIEQMLNEGEYYL